MRTYRLGINLYLETANQCEKYIQEYHFQDQELKRIFCKGKLTVNSLLEDYAHLIKAYILIYKTNLEESWINKAEELVKVCIKDFYDEQSGMFFYTPKSENKLIARKMDLTDGVISSSGSILAQSLFELGSMVNNEEYLMISKQMLANITDSLENGGPYVFGWAKLMLMHQLSAVHLTLKSDDQLEQLSKIQSKIVCSTIYPQWNINYTNKSCSVDNSISNIKICIGKSCYPTSTNTDYYIGLINSIKL